MIDFYLGMWDGLLLISALLLFLFRIRVEHKRSSSMEVAAEILDLEEFPDMSCRKAMITLSFSLILLLFSSELLVWAAIGIAQYLEVSELIIGLTVIAVGTSIPELVVSLTSALKGQTDLAIGNIIGSNIFNILTVLSIPAIFAPSVLDPLTLWRDYGLMFGMTMLLVIFAFKLGGHSGISRIRGGLLFSLWLGYIIFIYQTALVA
jgi:cation:H+ antiporter